MVFSSYSNASYLPLDSDQGVTFYKNENLLFAPPPPSSVAAASHTALVCRRNSSVAAMLTTSTGSNPFGGQPFLHHGTQHHGNNVCDDFQPVAHLSSNGYYGYVPPTAVNSKVMSTTSEQASTPPASTPASQAAVDGANGVGVLLDSFHPAAAATTGNDSYSMMMMDCVGAGSGGIVQVENYYQQQQQQQQQLHQYHQHLRKRKENGEEVEPNCKRRKTWLEEQSNDAGFLNSPNWNQASSNQMDTLDQPMDTCVSQQTPNTMNAAPTVIGFNGFQHHLPPSHQQTLISTPTMPVQPQSHTILQPKNRLPRARSPTPPRIMPLGSTEFASAVKDPHSQQQFHHLRQSHRTMLGDDCQQLEDLFISLHGSGFYLAC